jgi:hypothetical protein
MMKKRVTSSSPTKAATLDPKVQAYFVQHCLKCHGAEAKKDDFRIDTLSPKVGFESTPQWLEIMERINSGEMPPKEVKKRPTAKPLGCPTQENEAGNIVVARECLMTCDQVNDHKGGNILKFDKVPVQTGSSGVQIQVYCGILLEGFRPRKVVRFFPATWPVISLPKEEQFHGRE